MSRNLARTFWCLSIGRHVESRENANTGSLSREGITLAISVRRDALPVINGKGSRCCRRAGPFGGRLRWGMQL